MSKRKFLISLILAISVLMSQAGGVLAASGSPAFPTIRGTVQSITMETDAATGITTVLVTLMEDSQVFQTVRVSQKTAEQLGLAVPDDDGKPEINNSALGQLIEIKLTMVIPDQEEERNPVGNALEAFFSDIDGLDYSLIMTKHDEGLGFGIIAQALWLTRQIGGNSGDFQDILLAKQSNDYGKFSAYTLEDGTSPMNWGQLRKAIMQTDKKPGSDIPISNQNNNANGNNREKNNNKDKDKSNNGHGNGNNR